MPDCDIDERTSAAYDEAGAWPVRVAAAARWMELPESVVTALHAAADVSLRAQIGHLPICTAINDVTLALAAFLAEARDRYERAQA